MRITISVSLKRKTIYLFILIYIFFSLSDLNSLNKFKIVKKLFSVIRSVHFHKRKAIKQVIFTSPYTKIGSSFDFALCEEITELR